MNKNPYIHAQILKSIEENIKYIDEENYSEFFFHAGGETGSYLWEAGINFLNHIEKIPSECFAEYDKLIDIVLPANIEVIDYAAFQNCINLTTVDILAPKCIIWPGAFTGCVNLKSIRIPKDIQIINGAFNNCGSELVISYKGTKADWKKYYNPQAFINTNFCVECFDGKIITHKR